MALNAAAGLVVSEMVTDLSEGVKVAIEIIESGKALEKLAKALGVSTRDLIEK